MATIICGFVLAFSNTVFARDKATIDSLQHEPVSKFDLFLYVLFDRTKCLGGSIATNKSIRDGACMTTYPQYSTEKNYIALNVLITEGTSALYGYESWTSELKRDAIKNIVEHVAQDMGVDIYNGGTSYGAIQESINIVFPNADGEINLIEEDISNRIMLILTVNYRGRISKAILTPDRNISVSLESSANNNSIDDSERGVSL